MQGWWFSIATLGFAAEDTASGDEGYVITGHLGDGATSIGLGIWQPLSEGSYDVGEVEQTGGEYADASWVPYDGVEARYLSAVVRVMNKSDQLSDSEIPMRAILFSSQVLRQISRWERLRD